MTGGFGAPDAGRFTRQDLTPQNGAIGGIAAAAFFTAVSLPPTRRPNTLARM